MEGPNVLTHLNMLELLNLSDNELVTINLAELNLKNLAQLSLIGNKLTSIHCIPPTTFPSLLYLNICTVICYHSQKCPNGHKVQGLHHAGAAGASDSCQQPGID